MSDTKRVQEPVMRGPMGGGGPGGGMRGAVEKPKDFRGTTRRLLRYLKPQTAKLMIVFVLAIASTAFAVYGPQNQWKCCEPAYERVLLQRAW